MPRGSDGPSASPRFGSLHVPSSPFHTPHASPHFGSLVSSLTHFGSSLAHSLANVMWHTESKTKQVCPHIHSGIDELACRGTIRKPDSWCCESCETSNAIRMCLECGSCVCERHSYAHYEKQPEHTLFLQLNAETKPVYCYSCRFLVKEDNAEKNIQHIRAVLEDVQNLNVEILSKTTRSGRKRLEGASTNAFAAAAAAAGSSSSFLSLPPTHPDSSVMMTDIDAESDALPEEDPGMLSRRLSWQRVKSWHKVMPFLSKKSQLARKKEDQLRTCLFRWRNRALVKTFMSWKFVMRMGREERQKKKAAAGGSSALSIASLGPARSLRSRPVANVVDTENIPMISFDLSHVVPEGDEGAEDEDEEEEDVHVPRHTGRAAAIAAKAKLISGLPPIAPKRASSPPPLSGKRPKRSRSEERRPSTAREAAKSSQREEGEKGKAMDDLLSPDRRKAARAASARSSPKGERSESPTKQQQLKSMAAIKLAPGIMGLRNLGNTCYMNSVLQALSLTECFRVYYTECIPKLLPPVKHDQTKLLNSRAAKRSPSPMPSPTGRDSTPQPQHKRKSSDSDSSESDDEDEEDHSSLTRDFSDLLTTIWKGQKIQFTPDHFLQTVWTLYERFKGFKQQDAQEFVLFLLNQLSKEQETQIPKQRLDPVFQNPSLTVAKEWIRKPPITHSASSTGGRPSVDRPGSTTSIGSANSNATGAAGRKRKGDRNANEKDKEPDSESDEPSSTRRRSGRASTVISTTSSLSLADQSAALHNTHNPSSTCSSPTFRSASAPSAQTTYATPLPPSSLSSLELPSSSQPPTFVPRVIVAREHDFITQNFSGVVRSEIKCTVCSRVSASEADFLGMISVQVPPKSFLHAIDEAAAADGDAHMEPMDLSQPEPSPSSGKKERSAALHHSNSTSILAGGAANHHVAPATFLSVSRSLHHSRSDQTLSAHSQPPTPSSAALSAASISERNRLRHGEVTLQKCLSFTFNQPEVMEGANAYMCGGCKKKVKAEKYQVIQAVPPEYLFIHIGRTVYDMTTFSSKKDQTHIAFPLQDLDLGPFLPEQELHRDGYMYDLYAVVNHHGRGLNEGHFTSFGFSKEQDCWLLFNDARVTVVAPEKVLESQAYLLFYKRKEKPRNDMTEDKMETS